MADLYVIGTPGNANAIINSEATAVSIVELIAFFSGVEGEHARTHRGKRTCIRNDRGGQGQD